MAVGAAQVLEQSLKQPEQAKDQGEEQNKNQDKEKVRNQDSSIVGKALLEQLSRDLNIDSVANFDQSKTYASLKKLFQGPEYKLLFSQAHGLSDLFEVFCINQRKLATANVQKADKNTTAIDQALFSQIYTPPQVVQAMTELCLVEPFLNKAQSVADIQSVSVLDPCCGTGNFLIAAAAAFYKAYEKFDLPSSEICRLIIEHNIVGTDIDARALVMAKFALTVQLIMLSNDTAAQNLDSTSSLIKCLHNTSDVAEAALGSLSPRWKRSSGHVMNRRYSVVLTNPPYLGRKLIDRVLKLKLKKYYPECASDLSQIFLWKALDLVTSGGTIGFLSQSSFMHLPSALTLRKRILEEAQINLVIELGDGVFPLLAGSKADSSIIFLTRQKIAADEPAYYIDLKSAQEKSQNKKASHLDNLLHLNRLNKISKSHGELSSSNDLAFNFKRPQALIIVQAKENQNLASKADFKQGLATSSNEKFLRYAWEVEEDDKSYAPYAKGGGSERWWRTISSKVRWGENGEEIKATVAEAYPYLKGQVHWVVKNENYYFKPGLTFSFVNKHRLSVRKLPAGAIFDVGGSAIFSHDAQQENLLLAYLNSSLVSALAHDINPTINFQIGDLKRLPLLHFSPPLAQTLADLANNAITSKQELEPLVSPPAALLTGSSSKKTRLSQEGFDSHLKAVENLQSKLIAIEEEIDNLVLVAANQHFALDKQDQLELRHWVENRAQADTSAAAAVKLTSKIYFENQMAQAFAIKLWRNQEQLVLSRQIRFDQVCNFLNNKIETEPKPEPNTELEIDPDFAKQFIDSNLHRYFNSRFNQVLHEQFGGQPPVLTINGAVQATLPLLKNGINRPADLYRARLNGRD
jgi:type I restriction-modification system DNA methylase subunit